MITAHDDQARAVLNMCMDYMRLGATQLGQTLAMHLANECNAKADEASSQQPGSQTDAKPN